MDSGHLVVFAIKNCLKDRVQTLRSIIVYLIDKLLRKQVSNR